MTLSRSALFVAALLSSVASLGAARPATDPARPVPTPSADHARIQNAYAGVPLAFEPNRGQTDASVKFLARGPGYTLFLTSTEAVLRLAEPAPRPERPGLPRPAAAPVAPPSVLRMSLVGATPGALTEAREPLAGIVNYFKGNDPAQWRTNIPTYGKVALRDVYPGIDLVYYGNPRRLEYDFVVAPGADPGAIRLAFAGADDVRLDARGDVVLTAAGRTIVLQRPVVYQMIGGARHEISSTYVWLTPGAPTAASELGVRVAAWDRSRPLVIDPVLGYSTTFGGSADDYAYGIAVDAGGNAYVTGATASADFPTVNPLPGGHPNDAFVTKLNAAGTALVYSTYLGGSGGDSGYAIAVDTGGRAYVAGSTFSTDFPVLNAFQPSRGGGITDAFVTKLDASGAALVYSTYLGGSGGEIAYAIAIDTAGSAYVAGATTSLDFPTAAALQGVKQGVQNAFVTKLRPDGLDVVYSTFFGGSGTDWAQAIAVDSTGNAYITGTTTSLDLPVVAPLQVALHETAASQFDAFVAKIAAAGTSLVYSTYLGGGGDDFASGIAIDSAGSAYVTGYTRSTDFPAVHALQPAFGGNIDAFVAKLASTGSSLVYSTYLGGADRDYGTAIAVDRAGSAYVTGMTFSGNFPTTPDAIKPALVGTTDAFVVRLTAAGSLLHSTYLGGDGYDSGNAVAVDAAGNVYVALSIADAVMINSAGVSKIAWEPDLTVTAVTAPATTLPGGKPTVTATVRNAGEVPAGGWGLRFYLALQTIRHVEDVALTTTASSAPLAAGQSTTLTASLTIPKMQAARNYYVIACVDDANQVAELSESNNCTASAVMAVTRPDLVITALGLAPLGAVPGGTTVATTTVRNQGLAAAPASTLRFYLGTAPARGRTDLRLTATQADTALNPGATVTTTTTLAIPASVALGSYFVIACADDLGQAAESVEANNCAAGAFSVAKPELLVSQQLVTPTAVVAGGTVSMTTTVQNVSPTPAGASTLRFYLGLGMDRDPAHDVRLAATQAVGPIAGSASAVTTTTLTIPATTADGNYVIHACADDLNVVAEAVETNNCHPAGVSVQKPDLRVTFLRLSIFWAAAGDKVTATTDVNDNSPVAAPASTLRFYLGTGPFHAAADVRLAATQAVGALTAFNTTATTTVLTIPTNTAIGNYSVFACADDLAAIAERDETNNCAGAPLDVQKPDLVVTSLTLQPGLVARGGQVTVTTWVLDNSPIAAPASTLRFYVGAGPNRDAAHDVRLAATQAVAALPSGAVSTTQTVATIPTSLALGNYVVFACADDLGVVSENNETNNCRASGGLLVQQPDLAVSALTVTPSSVVQGHTVVATSDVRNQAEAPAPASTLRFYLGPGPARSLADRRLSASQAVSALAGGATLTRVTPLTIPAGVRPGTYYLIACADDLAQTAESDERNNCRAASGPVEVTRPAGGPMPARR